MREMNVTKYTTESGRTLIEIANVDLANVIIGAATREQLKELGAACYAAVNHMILMEKELKDV